MTKVIATFSNGYTDEYKGHRDVTAGWAIFCVKTDEVLASGHSLDRDKADKTARGYVNRVVDTGMTRIDTIRGAARPGHEEWVLSCARKNGYTGPAKRRPLMRWVNEHNAKRTAIAEKGCRVEIVDI